MTNNDQVDHLFGKLPSGSTWQPGGPFHIVLVDIKIAAEDGYIHCVEKPLEGDEDLKFVALSYRWGEVQETTVDTGLGYMANVTSFDLYDFCELCKNMTLERDLKDMEYVWVDAICVDQANMVKRKTTIYQMTNIYERANYIVAVPDLHLGYLRNISRQNGDIIANSRHHGEYLYHLIHGNAKKLDHFDDQWLDRADVPEDSKLRYLLKKYSSHFAPAFTICEHANTSYDAQATLDHIYETNPTSRTSINYRQTSHLYKTLVTWAGRNRTMDRDAIDTQGLHICDDERCCPLNFFDKKKDYIGNSWRWNQHSRNGKSKQCIIARSKRIRQSMEFLADLIKDWSTRVWVISEFHIAKNKNNKMKYWFLQLRWPWILGDNDHDHSFFEFDFSDDPSVSLLSTRDDDGEEKEFDFACCRKPDAIYHLFHEIVRQQLDQQTFLEMMLKSKASRHEDRFHAILPSSEYKHKLISKYQVDSWHIDTLVSVKLRLYEWMSTKDKLRLLFLSSMGTNLGRSLPTFATSNIRWDLDDDYLKQDKNIDTTRRNFDSDDDSILMLTRQTNNLHKLTIKPKKYYYQTGIPYRPDPITIRLLVQLDLPPGGKLDLICIPNIYAPDDEPDDEELRDSVDKYHYIFLIGCREKRKFIMAPDSHRIKYHLDREGFGDYEFVDDDADAKFNIY